MSSHRSSEAVYANVRIPELDRQRVPDRGAGNRNSPSVVCSQPVSWDDKLNDDDCRTSAQTLSRGNVGHRRPIVHQVLRSFCVLTSVCHNAELEANPLRNVVIIVLSSFIIEVVIRNFHICM